MNKIINYILFWAYTLFALAVHGQVQFGPKNPLDFPKSDKYSIEAINCKNSEGKSIYGVAYVPKGKNDAKYPLVILSHGYSGSLSYLTDYGTALAENGIACYSFDFCGGSNIGKSEGKTTEMSVLTEKNDLEAVLATSKGWSFVDSKKIFLSGESQGGFVTALAGAERLGDIRGMVLLYPAFHMPDAMRKMFPDKKAIQVEMDFPNNMKIGKCYVDALYDMDAYEVTKNFNKKVLIIHGNKDMAVPISYSERAIKEYPSATLKIINGAGHVFIAKEQRDEAIGYFVEFIKNNCL
jgi:hypothetical protein